MFNIDVLPGDMAVMKPTKGDWVGSGISFFAGPYSHVARIVDRHGGCVDANPPCVRRKNLDEFLRDGREVLIRRLNTYDQIGEGFIKHSLDSFLNPQIDAKADYADRKIFRFAFRILLRWLPADKSEGTQIPHIPKKWHCAELFAVTDDYCFKVDSVPGRAHKWTCPSDLAVCGTYHDLGILSMKG